VVEEVISGGEMVKEAGVSGGGGHQWWRDGDGGQG
jgi:hypothetical protein